MTEQFVMAPIRWILAGDLTGSEFQMLCLLKYHADEEGNAWPAQKVLAGELHITPSAVSRILTHLHEKGYITSTSKPASCKRYKVAWR